MRTIAATLLKGGTGKISIAAHLTDGPLKLSELRETVPELAL